MVTIEALLKSKDKRNQAAAEYMLGTKGGFKGPASIDKIEPTTEIGDVFSFLDPTDKPSIADFSVKVASFTGDEPTVTTPQGKAKAFVEVYRDMGKNDPAKILSWFVSGDMRKVDISDPAKSKIKASDISHNPFGEADFATIKEIARLIDCEVI
ncbi:MAG: hypothetical protein SFT81_06725 [Candidatus Caenarcaniphilales bacterium]|nr:hypothetical protein [Candidatus Caenarcaniphilales bacterium]